MIHKKYAFTLVELIVVITILAVLWTIAFISMQWYAQRAKNSKIVQDIKTLSSAVEIWITSWKIWNLSSLVLGDLSDQNWVTSNSSITLFDDNNNSYTWILDWVSIQYSIWNIDFQSLRQNGDDFKDWNQNAYIIATALTGSTAYFQIAGQQIANSGEYLATIKWNYYPQSWDTASLVSASGSQTPITDNQSLWIQAQDTHLY